MRRRAALPVLAVLCLLALAAPLRAGDLADGQQLYFNHDFAGALAAFERAAAASPDDAAALYHVGLAQERLGRTAEARASYEKALTLDARQDLAQLRLARLCVAMNDTACAREQYAALREAGVRLGRQDQEHADSLLGAQPKGPGGGGLTMTGSRTPQAEAAVPSVDAVQAVLNATQHVPKPMGRRVALVIGNGAYGDNALRNPPGDARAMAAALRRCGFEVIERIDADRGAMLRAIHEFGEKLAGTEAGLFYFAGHGIQVKGRNFLIPTGAAIDHESSVEYEGVDVGRVMVAMEEGGKGTHIVILDACRNNPFQRAFRSATRGLAMVDAPRGTYIAYSTAPGDVAADGSGEHGLYTDHLLRNIETPGLPIEEVMKRVRKGVITTSGGAQVPWESSSLTGEFSFMP